jgi:hypothetical protein
MKTISITQWGKKRSLLLYGINDNMHPQQQKFKVSHENVIEKPKHLMTIFPSSTFKDMAKNFLINNSTLKFIFTQIYSHLQHLHKKNVTLV